jgi:signal transduction histidine kinase
LAGSDRRPHLALRFAVGSLVAFVIVGAGVGVLLVRYVRERVERIGTFHAQFVTNSVLAPALVGVDLSTPLTGAAYEKLNAFLADHLLNNGRDLRVKIWRPDGTIVYSDARRLVGRSFPEELPDLHEAMDGHAASGISDLSEPENVFERGLADKLFFTYAPLRLNPDGPVVAVAEIYQDYSVIQGDIDGLFHEILLVFGAGLLLLYAILLPISLRTSRDLRERNARLNELLAREQQTVAKLRDLNQKKDDFVAAASHELRTPLTSIIGYLASLKSELGADPAIRAEFVAAAEGQAKRLLRQITNLLSASDLESGMRPMLIERIDFVQLARQVAAGLPYGPDRVRFDVPPDAAVVVTDRGRLEDVLVNLLDNALKYSEKGSEVEVGTTADDGTFRFWVRDRGVGIDPADLAAIFDRFHQSDQSSTRRFGGIGLGLHLAKGLVDELGGGIDVESTPGRGSTFTVTIPMAVDLAGRASTGAVREAVVRTPGT